MPRWRSLLTTRYNGLCARWFALRRVQVTLYHVLAFESWAVRQRRRVAFTANQPTVKDLASNQSGICQQHANFVLWIEGVPAGTDPIPLNESNLARCRVILFPVDPPRGIFWTHHRARDFRASRSWCFWWVRNPFRAWPDRHGRSPTYQAELPNP